MLPPCVDAAQRTFEMHARASSVHLGARSRGAGARSRGAVARAPGAAAVVLITIALIAVAAMALARPASVVAADPSPGPTPLVFHTPQYLVFMESHQTMNGPVTDNVYWLYISPPDADGAFVVPDGGGGVWHYSGRLIGGPFTGAADACPAMLGVGVTSLQAWWVAAGEDAQVADCAVYAATPKPASTAAAAAGPGSVGSTAGEPTSPAGRDSTGIILAVLGALLAGGGVVVSRTGRPLAPVAIGPGGRSEVDATPPEPPEPPEPPADPCAGLVADEARASAAGRYLNDLLASCRRYEALLQEQIDVLANLVLPGSVLLDLGFAAGGLSGGLGPKLIATTGFRQALGEAVAKDLLKELAKQGLGSAGGGLDPEKLRSEGNKSAVKETILTAVQQGITHTHFFDSLWPAAPEKVFRSAGEYGKFLGEMREFSESVAEPIKSGIGAVIDLYQGVSDGLEMKARLDQLRAQRDRIADRRVDLEMKFESALEAQHFAAERLAHCRSINDPSWRP
jgi:hypothetical protein